MRRPSSGLIFQTSQDKLVVYRLLRAIKFLRQTHLHMKARCPLCHTDLEIPDIAGKGFLCRCGAYGEITLLSKANLFLARAKTTFGIDPEQKGRVMEVVDGGIAFEGQDEPAIILWAKKPLTSR